MYDSDIAIWQGKEEEEIKDGRWHRWGSYKMEKGAPFIFHERGPMLGEIKLPADEEGIEI